MQIQEKIIALTLVLLTGCFRVGGELEPQINASVQDRYLKSLPPPFSHLSVKEGYEKWTPEWVKEERIGMGFAQELNLYQAITAFKRASFLLPPSDQEHRLQLNYDTLLAYYLGSQYLDTIYTYESTPLRTTNPQFTPYHDLLVMLYDSHSHLNQTEPLDALMQYMSTEYPDTASKLALSQILIKGNISALEKEAPLHPEVKTLLDQFSLEKKSTQTAQLLNSIVPGAGYFYVGQTQSAITALLLNSLFVWASVYFFQHGNTAAGIIFTSVEAGWYFGGIYGAGQEAKLYNERLYERLATPLMNEHRYFPILMLKYGF